MQIENANYLESLNVEKFNDEGKSIKSRWSDEDNACEHDSCISEGAFCSNMIL